MAWRRPGDKPLSEPMLLSLPTHICVTQPQWVKEVYPSLAKPSFKFSGSLAQKSWVNSLSKISHRLVMCDWWHPMIWCALEDLVHSEGWTWNQSVPEGRAQPAEEGKKWLTHCDPWKKWPFVLGIYQWSVVFQYKWPEMHSFYCIIVVSLDKLFKHSRGQWNKKP